MGEEEYLNRGEMLVMTSVLESIEGSADRMLRFLEKLVNIDSGCDNPEGIAEVAHTVGSFLEGIDFAVEYLEYPGVCTHVLARRKGPTGGKRVMILGHLDTVFRKGTAQSRPFTIKGEKAFGPGVLDMKGGVTIALFALEALAREGWNEKEIVVFFCGDEETGHPNSDFPERLMREAEGMNAVFNMETGADDGSVVVGRKGVAFLELVVQGKSAHSGKDPEKGASAILELAHKTVAIHGLTNYETGVTYNVGVVSGGTAANVIAGEAHAKIDARFVTVDQVEKVLSDLREIVNKSWVPGTTARLTKQKVHFLPMETTDAGMKLFGLVQEQAVKLGIGKIKPRYVGGGSDSCWTVKAGAPTVCAMGARGEFNHSEHEYIWVSSLVERAKLLASCIVAV